MAKKYVDGEIIVAFRDDVSSAEAEREIADFGLSVKKKIGSTNIYLVEVSVGSEQKWIEDFKKLASVRFAERNGIVILPRPWEPQ